MANINLRVGATKNISGYNEETKKFDTPILDVNEEPVDLTGSTVTFKTKGLTGSSSITTHTGLIIISPDDATALRWDLTSLPTKTVKYEVKIVLTNTDVIIIDGVLTISDRL